MYRILTLALAASLFVLGCYDGPTVVHDTLILHDMAPDAGPPGDAAMSWDSSELPSATRDTGPAGSTSSSGGWSTTGVLSAGDPLKQLSLQAVFPQAGDYTVEFGIQRPQVPAVIPIVEADITWTVEGNSVTRRVTVGNGTSVTGTGQACKVVMRDVSINGSGTIVPIPVSVQVAPGMRGTNKQPPTLETNNGGIGVWNVPPGGFTIIPIPEDAGVISVMVTVDAFPEPVAITAGQAVVRQVGAVIEKQYDPRTYDWVPVSAGANEIIIENFGPANNLRFSVTFGIDG